MLHVQAETQAGPGQALGIDGNELAILNLDTFYKRAQHRFGFGPFNKTRIKREIRDNEHEIQSLFSVGKENQVLLDGGQAVSAGVFDRVQRLFSENYAPNDINVINIKGSQTRQWISRLENADKVLVKDLRVIGTHDSAAYQVDYGHFKLQNAWVNAVSVLGSIPGIGRLVKGILNPITQTQNNDLYHQLQNGARYLDLRIARDGKTGQFYLSHTFGCVSMDDALKQIQRFMSENPGEFVELACKRDYANKDSIQPEHLSQFFDQVNQTLGADKLWAQKENDKFGNQTLKSVAGKALVCFGTDGEADEKALAEWRKKNGGAIQASNDQLKTNWANEETANLLVPKAIAQGKDDGAKQAYEEGKILQLDGAPTPSTGRIVRSILISAASGIVGLFSSKLGQGLYDTLSRKYPSDIRHHAEVTAEQIQPAMSDLNKGSVLTVDFLGDKSATNALVSQAIQQTTEVVRAQAPPAVGQEDKPVEKKPEVDKPEVDKPKLSVKKIVTFSNPLEQVKEPSKESEPVPENELVKRDTLR